MATIVLYCPHADLLIDDARFSLHLRHATLESLGAQGRAPRVDPRGFAGPSLVWSYSGSSYRVLCHKLMIL